VTPDDDAAGMAVSMRFDAQVKRTEAARSNLGNAMSYNQTQDGFLGKVQKALDRMSELSVLAQDVTKSDSDRALYNTEFQQLGAYVNDMAKKDFNGVSLFNGTAQNVTIDSEGGTFSMTGVNLLASAYTVATSNSGITTSANAVTALTNVKAAITQLASDRAGVGAMRVRLEYTNEQLGVLRDNLVASNSRIKDVDVAGESTSFAKYNILVQAGTAMLAQANMSSQSVLRLLN
jgi:flagellin